MNPMVPTNVSLVERVALVTGGGRGVGAAVAIGLAAAGARVAVTSRSASGCDDVVQAVRAAGGDAAAFTLVLEEEASGPALIDAVVEHFGRLDVLVNNAGIFRPHLVEKVTPDELDVMLAVNFRSPFHLCQAARPHLEESGAGSIVNVSALSATRGQSGMGGYAASKAAMLAMTRTMAREWGPVGIRVNAVVPGAIATDMIMPRDESKRADFLERMGALNALGRIAVPEDLVGPVLFLASDASRFVTGQALFVDGGAFE